MPQFKCVVESTELLGIKWKHSSTKELLITEWKIPEHLGTDSSLNTRVSGTSRERSGD